MTENQKDWLTGACVTAVYITIMVVLSGCSSHGIETPKAYVWDNGESFAPGERNPGGVGRVSQRDTQRAPVTPN